MAKIIGARDVDLDQYAPAPASDNDGKWGHYVFRYMKKEPPQEWSYLDYIGRQYLNMIIINLIFKRKKKKENRK